MVVERGGVGAGASGRNGGFLFRQPAGWVQDALEDSVAIYERLQAEGPVPFDFQPWPMLLLAVEEKELEHARSYAAAVGGEEVDLREEAWLADDLAGGYAIGGSYVLDAMSATVAMAEDARRIGVELHLGCEAKRILVSGGRVAGVATDAGVISSGRVVVSAGPMVRPLLRTAGVDLPVSAVRGWLLATGRVDPPPPYAIEQALWPEQAEMGAAYGSPTLEEVAAGAADDEGLVSLLLGGRPAGHCVIGTSLHRSIREEPEAEGTVRRLAERAVRVAPRLREVPVVSSWSGRRAMTPDGFPVAGPVGGIEGLEVVGGFQSIGMVTIPSVARRWARGEAAEFAPDRLA